MNLSIKRMQAILVKDYKEFSRNLAVSSTILVPLIIAAFYSRMGMDTIQMHFMAINMTFSLVATYIQCCLIAEEKEKNTLRNLMLSPASIPEILIGKSMLTFIITILILTGSILLTGYNPGNILIMIIAFLLSSIFYITVGTLLGLMAKTVMESSVIVMPVFFLFSIGPFASALVEKYPVMKVIEWLPSTQLINLAESLENQFQAGDLVQPFSLISLWIFIAMILTVIVYKKRMTDDI